MTHEVIKSLENELEKIEHKLKLAKQIKQIENTINKKAGMTQITMNIHNSTDTYAPALGIDQEKWYPKIKIQTSAVNPEIKIYSAIDIIKQELIKEYDKN